MVDRIPYEGPQRLKGEIAFENVVFGYTKDRPVLKGINLHIPAGRKVALVGHSGSGKTTLAKSIPRFYSIEQGSLRIDGLDNDLYPLHILRQNISMVLQDSVLFEGTVRENIEIGRPGATLEETIEAAKKANIHDTILNLPEGYETIVREQGNNFSAGQRQRLAIARAILRDAPILILDEPTANLDVEAEAEVMHALNVLIAGRTVLTISHRLSTLGQVDEILVMQHGQIVEQGTFKELKRQNGVFATLLEEQNRYNLDRDEKEEGIVRPASADTASSLSRLLSATQPLLPAVPQSSVASNGSHSPVLVATPNGQSGTPVVHKNGQDKIPASKNELPQKQEIIPTQARIFVQMDGKNIGEYRLHKTLLTIGRSPTNDIQISSQRVSRLHAILRWKDGAWVIEDAESLNGLSCQGQRIDQLALVDGDQIYLDPTIVLQYDESLE